MDDEEKNFMQSINYRFKIVASNFIRYNKYSPFKIQFNNNFQHKVNINKMLICKPGQIQ